MVSLMNKIIFYAKVFLLLIVFSVTLYILFLMQAYYENQFMTIVRVFIPLFFVLIIFVVSFFFKEGNNNILFNISCFLAFLAIIVVDFRTLCDKNMILWLNGDANFYFFQNQLSQIKILCYLMFIGNLVLIYKEKSMEEEIEIL